MAARQFTRNNVIKAGMVTASIGQASANAVGVIIDAQGFDSITWITRFGAIAATSEVSIVVEGSDASDMANAVEITEVDVAADQDNKIFAVEVYQPKYRYNRLTVKRAVANADIDDVLAILSRLSKAPPSASQRGSTNTVVVQ